MTQTDIPAPRPPAADGVPLQWGPAAGMYVSPALAAAFMYEVWKASPQSFGNLMKKAMASLWASSANGGKRHE